MGNIMVTHLSNIMMKLSQHVTQDYEERLMGKFELPKKMIWEKSLSTEQWSENRTLNMNREYLFVQVVTNKKLKKDLHWN